MARINKEYEARMQGMIYACNLVEKQGLDALKRDIKMRGITRLPIQISTEKAAEIIEDLSENLYTTFLTMTLMALDEAYGFKKKRMMRFKETFDKMTHATYDMDWLGGHYVSMSDYLQYLKEECGIDFNADAEERVAKCQSASDERNPDYKMVHLNRLITEMTENGHEDAATWLLERFCKYH